MTFTFSSHDSLPAEETQAVDDGLGAFNDRAAPLHEVQPLACFARTETGQLAGGAVGRRWGRLCEIQQLWVVEPLRGQGLGAALVRAFETHAAQRGCTSFYLETFSFQAPQFYERLGYRAAFVRHGFPHGIAKFHMVRDSGGEAADGACGLIEKTAFRPSGVKQQEAGQVLATTVPARDGRN